MNYGKPIPFDTAAIIERLAAHRALAGIPREQLEWLAAHGSLRRFEAGERVGAKGEPIDSLYVVLDGHFSITVVRGGVGRKVLEWRSGDISGMLPYSRLTASPGVSTAEAPSEILMIHSDHFPEMISRCHEVTAVCVHVMLDRARRFTRSDLQDERLRSLGRLAAGLAHELNNPASAVARSARELFGRLFEIEATALALGAMRLTPEQLDAIQHVRKLCEDQDRNAAMSPLQRADRDEAVADWLADHHLGDDVAETLAESALDVDCLDPLARVLDDESLGFALRSVGAGHRARRLAGEVQMAAERVHTLVAAIKGFTYMDQNNVRKPVVIGQGLADTLTVLASKARSKSVTVSVQVADDVPPVEGFGGELNQVWANLIDNAIDAAPEAGRVEVSASRRDGMVVVQVVDNGPGMPEEIATRIFEPFFTTKPQGQGTGLGLDIAQRLVHEHNGQIEVESRPGRTEFRVTLPAS